MERLTERYKDYIANIVLIRECGDKLCKDICDDIECNCSKCELEKVLEKLLMELKCTMLQKKSMNTFCAAFAR